MATAIRPVAGMALSVARAHASAAAVAAGISSRQPRVLLHSRSHNLGCRQANPLVLPGTCRFTPQKSCGGSKQRNYVSCSVETLSPVKESSGSAKSTKVRVRFAPSPTGNLHVGGARTALYNWFFARANGGDFILRVEDTDLARSTRESEELMKADLRWLGLTWDEGPETDGPCGPYRQSERTKIYKDYVDQLVASGKAYPCFCTDEELEAMRTEAEAKKLPPKYSGKWATASKEEVEAELAKGTPHTYRFRVPQDDRVVIQDLVRGEVAWDTNTLGDFIILRSNKQPVYNFCVAVDDATMAVTHVLRAEEHLPNTLRQVLIYKALGWQTPKFAHLSLILAPDKSKLSKRHGATSVGEFREQGFLPEAMINYLALLGWNDGTEQEIFNVEDLTQKFTIERITKSPAVFDLAKLTWMNGQHLRLKPEEDLVRMVGESWQKAGLVADGTNPIVKDAVTLVKNGVDVAKQANPQLLSIVSYPLQATLESEEAKPFIEGGLRDVVGAIVADYDSGKLPEAIAAGHDGWKGWTKALGKELKRKGKNLFMPLRIALTGSMAGPDVGDLLSVLTAAEKASECPFTSESGFIPVTARIEALRQYLASSA